MPAYTENVRSPRDIVAKVESCNGLNFWRELEAAEIDDSCNLSRATDVASEFNVRRRGSLRTLHENHAYGPQKFGPPVQNDFCNSIQGRPEVAVVRPNR